MTPKSEPVGRPSRSAATAAIEAHVKVLDGTPMRAAIGKVLEKHEKLGGKERRFTAFATRELSRHLRLLELWAKAAGWPSVKLQLQEDEALLRYALWRHRITGADVKRVMVEVALPGPVRPRSIPDKTIEQALLSPTPEIHGDTPLDVLATRFSFPNWLAAAIASSAPAGQLEAVFDSLNKEPKLTLRARPPGAREELLEKLRAEGHELEPCAEAPDAFRVAEEKRAIFESGLMKTGRLQVMELGSQLLAQLCQLKPGMTAVDYCAGAGGKTLALADAVGPTGKVFAHDSSSKRLDEAKRRVKELKLRHVSFPTPPRIDLADVVLVDAPCSGTGTLNREPDQKWKLSAKAVADFAKTQRSILDTVALQVKPGGVIVYGTCSVLRAEDEEVVDAFLATHPDFALDGSLLRVWPHEVNGGGFFGARLRKTG